MTLAYTTGTVSVTAGSAVVTGVGTAWTTAGIVGGVFGADRSDGNPIPILSVDSDTQITLSKPWRGATAAAQPYWIVRDTAYLRQITDNAQKLATYIARLDNASLAAFAALAGSMVADRLPFATGNNAMAWTTLSAFARSFLDDANGPAVYATLGEVPLARLPPHLQGTKVITDANAFVETGWAYGENAANAPTNAGAGDWYLYRNDAVSGPWGDQAAISYFTGRKYVRRLNGGSRTPWLRVDATERGSNANGEYVRFGDGTQICWGNYSHDLAISTAMLGGFRSSSVGISFAAAFVSAPILVAAGGAATTLSVGTSTITTTTALIYHSAVTSQASATRAAAVTAFGRWY